MKADHLSMARQDRSQIDHRRSSAFSGGWKSPSTPSHARVPVFVFW
jgi:hypothetical protein